MTAAPTAQVSGLRYPSGMCTHPPWGLPATGYLLRLARNRGPYNCDRLAATPLPTAPPTGLDDLLAHPRTRRRPGSAGQERHLHAPCRVVAVGVDEGDPLP